MDATSGLVLTGAVVSVGRLAEGKGVDLRIWVGVVVCAYVLATVDGVRPKLASQISLLILVTAVLTYGLKIAQKLNGINKIGSK